MSYLAVDDERPQLKVLCAAIRSADSTREIAAFGTASEALDFVRGNHVEVAFLDINLPGMSGVELAKRIKQIQDDANIVFCTAYADFALEAMEMHASGYLLKPVSAEDVRKELKNLRHPVASSDSGPELLEVHTFGNFEAFANGAPLQWKRSKAKEALAFLIDNRGAGCSNGEIALALWEDDGKSPNVRTVISSLRSTLREAGMEGVLVKRRNMTAVDVSRVSCDFYRFLEGDDAAAVSYLGRYMDQYSWGEPTKAAIEQKCMKMHYRQD